MHSKAEKAPVAARLPVRSTRGSRIWLLGVGVATFLALVTCATVATEAVRKFTHPLKTDFGVFYAAGRLAAEGHALWVYQTHSLNAVEVHAGGRALHLFYPYPPYVTSMLSLLGRLPVASAFAVWTGVNVLAYAGAAVLVIRQVDRGRPRILAGLALVLCLPLLLSVAQGENGGLIALGFVLAASALTKAPAVSSTTSRIQLAAGTAILALKPQFLLVPLVLVVLGRRRDQLLAVVGTGAILFVLGLMSGGIAAYGGFIGTLKSGLSAGTKYHWGPGFNYTFQAQAQSLLGHGAVSTLVWFIAAGALLVLVGLIVVRSSNIEHSAFDARAAALPMAAVAILSTTHAMYHDLVLLWPAIVVALFLPAIRWQALFCALAVMLDPILYPATGIHVTILALTAVACLFVWESIPGLLRTMDGDRFGSLRTGLWKLSALPRWGSASGSETPLR